MARPEVQDQDSPPVVTFMTTGHLVLQTARSAGCCSPACAMQVEDELGPVRDVVFVLAVNAGLHAYERGWLWPCMRRCCICRKAATG